MKTNLRSPLTRLYMRSLLATPRGQARLLAQIAEAEDSGEARVYDEALARVEDERLKKMITRHREDESRHGQLLRAAVKRTGADPGPVPPEPRAVDRIDANLGGFFHRPIEDERGVMMAYLTLQVIEERAIEQFGIYGPSFESIDPETHPLFAEVAKDEERHLEYCRAIAAQYEPDEAKRNSELARLRHVEVQAHRETERANTIYALEHGLLRGSFVRGFWRMMNWFGDKSNALPFTPFAEPTSARA